jgi:pimeloyl-ACP methyl ester carboxylesterase
VSPTRIALVALLCGIALVPFSYALEAIRRPPRRPKRLAWAPDAVIEYATVGDLQMRFIRMGSGPNLLLLHTLRTHLDLFQTIIPELAERFTVYAVDYPGHGWSDIPPADYAPEDFYRWVTGFLDTLRLERVTLAGISIGATIALVLAARGDPRVTGVVAINPYDYPPVGSVRQSSLMARLILGPSAVPILGPTLMRLRNRFVVNRIMLGGVAEPAALFPAFRRELYDVGLRRGHYQGFLSLLAHEHLWSEARTEYSRIRVPTLLVYSDQDWAPMAMRERTRSLLPPAVKQADIAGGGHFLCLDRPQEVAALIRSFAEHASP